MKRNAISNYNSLDINCLLVYHRRAKSKCIFAASSLEDGSLLTRKKSL